MNKRKYIWTIGLGILSLFLLALYQLNSFYKSPLGPSLELTVKEDSQTIQNIQASDGNEQILVQDENCGNTGSMMVLVLGVDNPFGGDPQGADLIRLVKVDFSQKEITIVAIPRDLWVTTGELAEHGIEEERLGLTYYYGKFYSDDDEIAATSVLARTIYDNFEVAPDYYVNIHMATFADMVDELGGIEINVPSRFHTPSGDIEAGLQTLDGLMTMEYARTMLIDNEWDRWGRQHLVLLGIRDKLLDPSIWPEVPGIIEQFDELVTTDLSPEQIVDLTCMIDEVSQENITLLEIGHEMVQGGDDGVGVMYPDVEKIIEFLDGIFGNNG